MTVINTSDLTQATLEGSGIFDVLMRANKAHLEAEFAKNRIKGPEYATVYLGSLTQVMQTALQFLLTKEKTDLEAQLLQKQIALAQIQIDKTTADKLQVEAQTALINQQKANLLAEEINIPKQGLQIEAQTAQVTQQTVNLAAQKLGIEAETAVNVQRKTNLADELLTANAQRNKISQEVSYLLSQKSQVEAQAVLTTQQKANAVTENTVLVAQECKLRAEFDVLMASKLKTAQETTLLAQKVTTEKAQTQALGVDADSVVGKQKLLYQAQTDGFKRDAEQKAADILVKSWNVRRTTDEGTVADATNMLNDAAIGRAVGKLLTGVGA